MCHYTSCRLSYVKKDKLRAIIDDLLKRNSIRSSDLEYASPVVLIRKKTGELRI